MRIETRHSLVLALAAVACALPIAGCPKSSNEPGAEKATGGEGRCAHDIKQEKCPFCNPQLIEADGFCGEHGVAEALCYICRPYLKAAFRSKGDWCKDHDVPASQCMTCKPELKKNIQPGAGHGQPMKPAETAAPKGG